MLVKFFKAVQTLVKILVPYNFPFYTKKKYPVVKSDQILLSGPVLKPIMQLEIFWPKTVRAHLT